jgi:hypothetical protein
MTDSTYEKAKQEYMDKLTDEPKDKSFPSDETRIAVAILRKQIRDLMEKGENK